MQVYCWHISATPVLNCMICSLDVFIKILQHSCDKSCFGALCSVNKKNHCLHRNSSLECPYVVLKFWAYFTLAVFIELFLQKMCVYYNQLLTNCVRNLIRQLFHCSHTKSKYWIAIIRNFPPILSLTYSIIKFLQQLCVLIDQAKSITNSLLYVSHLAAPYRSCNVNKTQLHAPHWILTHIKNLITSD